ncbi:MAG: hypothetical protein ACOVJ5_00240, partial [Gloeomargaritales cyanobacterium]
NMKKVILTIAVVALLGSCEKKKKSSPAPTTPAATTKVWCIYSNFANVKAYLYCASSQDEFNTKMTQFTQPGLTLYPSFDIKSTCAECQ